MGVRARRSVEARAGPAQPVPASGQFLDQGDGIGGHPSRLMARAPGRPGAGGEPGRELRSPSSRSSARVSDASGRARSQIRLSRWSDEPPLLAVKGHDRRPGREAVHELDREAPDRPPRHDRRPRGRDERVRLGRGPHPQHAHAGRLPDPRLASRPRRSSWVAITIGSGASVPAVDRLPCAARSRATRSSSGRSWYGSRLPA